jgi:hypothetical protein
VVELFVVDEDAMKVTRFSRKRDLIVVDARMWSSRHDRWVSLAVDTASSDTVVTPDLVEELGYSGDRGCSPNRASLLLAAAAARAVPASSRSPSAHAPG